MSPCISQVNSKLSVITFFAKSHSGDVCGSNGLPLTPNSISILGQFQFLKTLKHTNLCEYLDVIRGKHERTIVVSEYSGTPLTCYESLKIEEIEKVFYQIADSLDYLNNYGIVNHNLEPINILIDSEKNVKLTNYGLHYMTNGGQYIPFPIGNVKYMSPEVILGSKNNIKGDVWSLGIIIAELFFQCKFWPTLKISNIMRKILSLCKIDNVLEKIAREHDRLEQYQAMNPDLQNLLESCLTISPRNRLTPYQILTHTYFQSDLIRGRIISPTEPSPNESFLTRFPLKMIYYWWQLAGGDVQVELKKEGLIRSEAPILSMPKVNFLNGKSIGPPKSQSFLFDNRIIMLKLTNLIERLSKINKQCYFPLIHYKINLPISYNSGMESLPLIIRERDTEYQFHRTILFSRLLKGYPFTRDLIVKEAAIDIPPPLRGHIWACILGVIENGSFESIDKLTPTSTDRQIEVDIPRCHQYDELLSSPIGHCCLKRLLKAWVTAHPNYVYWQGLDSLTAPFIYLNFNNEERAFLSLFKFIPKYLHSFFLKDNSAVIKEYLYKFSQLTAFHEPILAKHLKDIHFIPELFAIPWFLTMFSHVFPLHKIIHLWDKLLLGDNSFPLFIGISILKQLKSTLLASGFNECILLFSDLPDIVMETCVIESQKMYLSTPKSVCHRKFVMVNDETATALPNRDHQKSYAEFIIDSIELKDMEIEISPRISGDDLIELILMKIDKVIVIDLRSSIEFKRVHLIKSVNIPFTSVMLGDIRLESLNIDKGKLKNRNVVIVGNSHENAVLFSKFLVDCGVSRVAVLHNDFDLLLTTVQQNIFEFA